MQLDNIPGLKLDWLGEGFDDRDDRHDNDAEEEADGHAVARLLLWGIGMAAAVILGIGLFVRLRQSEALIQSLQHSITGTSPDDFADFRDGMAYYIRNVYFRLDHRFHRLPPRRFRSGCGY